MLDKTNNVSVQVSQMCAGNWFVYINFLHFEGIPSFKSNKFRIFLLYYAIFVLVVVDSLRAGLSEHRTPLKARLSARVHTSPGAQRSYYPMGAE
jgi:hypothetical protein